MTATASETIQDLRLPERLRVEAEKLAAESGATLEQFVGMAVAEKIAATKGGDYLIRRAARGSAAEALAILELAGGDGPLRPGDEHTAGST